MESEDTVKVKTSGSLLFGKTQVSLEMPEVVSRAAKKIETVGDAIQGLTDKFQSSGILENLKAASSSMRSITSAIFDSMGSMADTVLSVELVLDVITLTHSLFSTFCTPITPMSLLSALYSIYKLARSFIYRLPSVIRLAVMKLIGIDIKEEKEPEMEEVAHAEVGGAMLNLVYTALIGLLPRGVRNMLDSFQKYTRIKILEDLEWVYQIADVVLHIPVYVLWLVKSVIKLIWPDSKIEPLMEILEDKYISILSFIPELTTFRLVSKMHEMNQSILKDRSKLVDSVYVRKIGDLIVEAKAHVALLQQKRNSVPNNLTAVLTLLENHYTASYYTMQASHPEPVAILLYSTPGVGKTVFTQNLKKYWTNGGKNTVYEYTPAKGDKDFHDQYRNQNIWVEEDIGQKDEGAWTQYIYHIGMNPSRMDGAAVTNKSTIFFNSQVILGTSNIPLHRTRLQKVKGCGWSDPEAIYRRWIVVEFRRGDAQCPMYKYDVKDHVWKELSVTMDCSSPKNFGDMVFNMYKHNVSTFKKLLPDIQDSAPYSFTDALSEGRKIETKLTSINEIQLDTREDIDIRRRIQVVNVEGCDIEMEIGEEAQRRILQEGKLINGGSEIVGSGPIHIGDNTQWMDFLKRQLNECFDDAKDKIQEWGRALVNFFSEHKKLCISAGVISALVALGGIALGVYVHMKRESIKVEDSKEYEPFVSWAKPHKRTTAKDLYAEVWHTNIEFQDTPNATIAQVQKHVLRSVITYGGISYQGHVITLDSDHIVMPAHFLLGGKEEPTSVFVRSVDDQDRELLTAYFTPVKWDVKEDIVVLKYSAAHNPVFRSLYKALTKTPSSKELYLVTCDGVIPIGAPESVEVRSGVYRLGDRLFRADKCLVHHYDGKALQSPGLCGALAVTTDGYVVGWHVAGLNGEGYVRFWNQEFKNSLWSYTSDDARIQIRDTPIKGAIVADTTEYFHVSQTSSIEPSAMKEFMEREVDLCPDGIVGRAPAKLSGKKLIEENGELREVYIYDQSRTKNLTAAENPVNMEALDFACAYIERMVKKVCPEGIGTLDDKEVVLGFRADGEVFRKINGKASAGTTFKGLVSEWVDLENGEIHPLVKEKMAHIEKLARGKKKDWKSVMFKDCVKDELRDVSKVDKPRCFAAGPIEYTLLLRKYMGRLCSRIMKNRSMTGIMIGINATSLEWHDLWMKLRGYNKFFDGDYKSWDGAMRREFQERLNKILGQNTTESDLVETLLMHLCETTRVGKHDTFITNHSVPSGHGLTSLYNSLINKMYVAYAWYKLVGYNSGLNQLRMLVQFESDIFAPVYGDDIIVAVSSRIERQYNALTYTAVMDELGIGFTAATKGKHIAPFSRLGDISFLKRKFVAHRLFGTIVGPLDITVLQSTGAYIANKTEDELITKMKMSAIQRELILHPSVIYQRVWDAYKRCFKSAFGYEYSGEMTIPELVKAFTDGELRSDLFETTGEFDAEGLVWSRKLRGWCSSSE